jgi:hypothetical protein
MNSEYKSGDGYTLEYSGNPEPGGPECWYLPRLGACGVSRFWAKRQHRINGLQASFHEFWTYTTGCLEAFHSLASSLYRNRMGRSVKMADVGT